MVGSTPKRSKIIVTICIIGWVLVILNFLEAFSPTIKKIGQFYPALYSLLMCLQFIAFVGIWYMKRWGVELFISSFFGMITIFLFMGKLEYSSFSLFSISFYLSVIIILLLLFYYRKMDINL